MVITTVQVPIIVITKDTIHDRHINIHDHRTNPDHHIIEAEALTTITTKITEIDKIATREAEGQTIKITDKVSVTDTVIIKNGTINQTEIE